MLTHGFYVDRFVVFLREVVLILRVLDNFFTHSYEMFQNMVHMRLLQAKFGTFLSKLIGYCPKRLHAMLIFTVLESVLENCIRNSVDTVQNQLIKTTQAISCII